LLGRPGKTVLPAGSCTDYSKEDVATGQAEVDRFYVLGNRFLLFVCLAFFVNGAEDFAQIVHVAPIRGAFFCAQRKTEIKYQNEKRKITVQIANSRDTEPSRENSQ